MEENIRDFGRSLFNIYLIIYLIIYLGSHLTLEPQGIERRYKDKMSVYKDKMSVYKDKMSVYKDKMSVYKDILFVFITILNYYKDINYGGLYMVNEVVKYHNDLNTVPMRKWTKEEMDFFFSIISKLKEKGTREIKFDKYQLAELARYTVTHNKRFEETMERLVKNISQIHYIERTSNSLELMNLFSRFKVTWEDDLSDMTLVVKVTEEFNYVINKLQVEFTSWELEEFTTIRSTYAKTMYRLLKQWRTIGKIEYKVEMFKQLLDMPNYYTPSEIDKNVLKPISRELLPFFPNLKIKKIKSNKRGTPVIAYEFTFTPEKIKEFIDYSSEKHNDQKSRTSKNSLEITPRWLMEDEYKNHSNDKVSEVAFENEKEKLKKELENLWD